VFTLVFYRGHPETPRINPSFLKKIGTYQLGVREGRDSAVSQR
jgi:hypothetical protein